MLDIVGCIVGIFRPFLEWDTYKPLEIPAEVASLCAPILEILSRNDPLYESIRSKLQW